MCQALILLNRHINIQILTDVMRNATQPEVTNFKNSFNPFYMSFIFRKYNQLCRMIYVSIVKWIDCEYTIVSILLQNSNSVRNVFQLPEGFFPL